MSEQADELNERFGLEGAVEFVEGPGGLTVARLRRSSAAATVALMGAHVLDYTPSGHGPVLWVSRHSRFKEGAPIRGGIPVCWPVFADQSDNPEMPLHGFARRKTWTVAATDEAEKGGAALELELRDDPQTLELWPHRFRLQLTVTLGRALRVDLVAQNTDEQPWQCTGALHSYFRVGDVKRVAVRGLDGVSYRDKTDEFRGKRQKGAVTIGAEVDRVYTDTTADCLIEDPVMERRIRVAKEGSRTTVVWNPWAEKARAMDDFGEAEYGEMLCVETANAADEVVRLAPGEQHALAAVISAEQGEG
ncbi:MAG: D-hexose-6-phosphate mutarotase [Planctomycetota bacterium]